VARCLIIGCGCRGRVLARELVDRGHAVRGTTRDPSQVPAIEAAGAEAVVADPDRVATLVGSLDHVTVVCVLLGSAIGSEQELAALHGTRLEMLLTKVVDTTARGVVYEAAGTVDDAVLREGAERVRAFGERSLALVAVLDADPADHDAWLRAALDAIGQIL
jgi:putative NADH-flavin reductase